MQAGNSPLSFRSSTVPDRSRWRSLAPGLAILAALLVASAAVLRYGRMITMHGRTIRLFVAMADARNVMPGSEVWLAGRKVGIVRGIGFAPPSPDTLHRVIAALDVLAADREFIRRNATAQIRAGATLVAPPVVYLGAGTPAAPPVSAGDTIRAVPGPDLEQVTSRVAVASKEFPAIISNVKLLAAQLRTAQGTLGAIGVDGMPPAMARTQERMAALGADLTTPRGSLGRILSGRGGLMTRAQRVLGRVDSLRARLASNHTTYGRLGTDSTLVRQIADLRDEASIVRAMMASDTGTVGRSQADSAVTNALAAAERSMTSLLTDVRQHPLRYVRF